MATGGAEEPRQEALRQEEGYEQEEDSDGDRIIEWAQQQQLECRVVIMLLYCAFMCNHLLACTLICTVMCCAVLGHVVVTSVMCCVVVFCHMFCCYVMCFPVMCHVVFFCHVLFCYVLCGHVLCGYC